MIAEINLIDRKSGTSKRVSFGWASIQIERMYAASERIFQQLRNGVPLVTQNWVYEPILITEENNDDNS